MTLEELFERPRTRRIFFAAIIGIVTLLLIARYFALPTFDSSLTQGGLPLIAKIAEDLSATILVTVTIAAFLWWITPSRVRNSGIAVVEPRELKVHFNEALATSSEWQFFGGCGRYFRSAVLVEMQKRARSESTSKRIGVVILNPENTILCEKHARYRSGTRRGKNEGNWTTSRVKQELLATIVITKRFAHSEGLLDIQIYVADHFSGFRVDISQNCAIETREDPTAPALLSEKGSYYYSALSDEYRLWRNQSREITNGEVECESVTDLKSLKHALLTLNLEKHGLTDTELEEVLATIKLPKNPYE